MTRQSPLAEDHRANGAHFREEEGWSLPLHFGDFMQEYLMVRSKAGLMDLSDHCLLGLNGPDRVSFLQGMASNDVAGLSPGQGIFAAFTDVNGKILADVKIFCTEKEFFLQLKEPLKEKILAHLDRYLIADEVEITDLSGTYGILSLQGPKSTELLEGLLGTKTLLGNEFDHGEFQAGTRKIRIARATHTGETGYDLWVAAGDLRTVAKSIPEKGQGFPTQWVGTQAQEVLRIEAGISRYGVDMDDNTLILETGLDQAVSFDKGCYLGQEVTERIHSRGHVNKRLVGIILDGDSPAQRGDPIEAGGKEVGKITSSTQSPLLHRPIALGYVQRAYLTPGTPLTIQRNGKPLPSVVSPLPFKP